MDKLCLTCIYRNKDCTGQVRYAFNNGKIVEPKKEICEEYMDNLDGWDKE